MNKFPHFMCCIDFKYFLLTSDVSLSCSCNVTVSQIVYVYLNYIGADINRCGSCFENRCLAFVVLFYVKLRFMGFLK